MKIGALAQRSGIQAVTIRYYEQEGLLPPPARTSGYYRDYDDSHLRRLAFIRRCREPGLTLGEVTGLLRLKDAPRASCASVEELVQKHIDQVRARMQDLRALEAELRTLQETCSAGRSVCECGILGDPERAALQPKKIGGLRADEV